MQIDTDYLDPIFLLGEVQFRQGKHDEAEKALLEFLKRRDRLASQRVKGQFEQARLHSHDHVHLRLGEIYQLRGDMTRAGRHYHQALEANPNSVQANFQLARYYTDKMDPDSAKKYLAAAQRLQGTRPHGS